MKIQDVDLFYLSMPEIRDIGDGSQDALLVRICADGLTGWGECEASPLVSIANWVCPMSHAACKSVRKSVIGSTIDGPDDIVKLGIKVRANGLDIAQTDHTFSGIEIALWDLLGKKREQPVYQLLGYDRAFPKTPYASQLFGTTHEETYQKAVNTRQAGYRAVKFGWGIYGRMNPLIDAEHVAAAREGIGKEGILLIDAGTVWYDDLSEARKRLKALEEHQVLWLEEPFVGGALDSYAQLASLTSVKLAGGEGASTFHEAKQLIDHGGVGFIQIDTGRIGGISPALAVAQYAAAKRISYVNHTFTTQLALAASLAPYAGCESDEICEFPVEASLLANNLTSTTLLDGAGFVRIPETPGLGIEPRPEVIQAYRVDVDIQIDGRSIYRTPEV